MLPPCSEVVSYASDPSPFSIPPIIKDLENTRHRFEVHFGGGSRRGAPRLILDDVSDISQLPVVITTPAKPAVTQETQPAEPQTAEIPMEILTPPPASADPEEKKATGVPRGASSTRRQLFQGPSAAVAAPPASAETEEVKSTLLEGHSSEVHHPPAKKAKGNGPK